MPPVFSLFFFLLSLRIKVKLLIHPFPFSAGSCAINFLLGFIFTSAGIVPFPTNTLKSCPPQKMCSQSSAMVSVVLPSGSPIAFLLVFQIVLFSLFYTFYVLIYYSTPFSPFFFNLTVALTLTSTVSAFLFSFIDTQLTVCIYYI